MANPKVITLIVLMLFVSVKSGGGLATFLWSKICAACVPLCIPTGPGYPACMALCCSAGPVASAFNYNRITLQY